MMFFGNDTPYKTLLNIVAYTNIVLIIGGLINSILSIIFSSGMSQYTSLGLLFTKGTFAYGIGNTIEIFYVWEFNLNLARITHYNWIKQSESIDSNYYSIHY